jgi:hypothetical protein
VKILKSGGLWRQKKPGNLAAAGLQGKKADVHPAFGSQGRAYPPGNAAQRNNSVVFS